MTLLAWAVAALALFLGALLGVFTAALCVAASRADRNTPDHP